MGSFFSFTGRTNRLPYFLQLLVIIVAEMVVIFGGGAAINQALGWNQDSFTLFALGVGSVASVFTLFPAVRRLHDLDRPGIHYLLLLIPIYNLYLGLCMLFQRGTAGPNRFGPDPLALGAALAQPVPTPPPQPNWEAPRPNTQPRDLTVPSVPSGQIERSPTELSPEWGTPAEPAMQAASEMPPPSRSKTQFYSAIAQSEPSEAPPAAKANGDARKIVGFLVTYSWRPEGDLFPLREGRNLIGRDPAQCDITIAEDDQLSAVNSHITFRKNFVIGDMMSMGGTDVDNQSVQTQFHPLANYASIRTGATVWTFVAVNPAAPAKPEN